MKEEKDFFKTCFDTVSGLEVKNESQAIAKEVILSEVERLESNWKELKEYVNDELNKTYLDLKYANGFLKVSSKMQELESGNNE